MAKPKNKKPAAAPRKATPAPPPVRTPAQPAQPAQPVQPATLPARDPTLLNQVAPKLKYRIAGTPVLPTRPKN